MEKCNFTYSTKNIPIPSERQYKLQLVEKIEALIKKMRWKAVFAKEKSNENKEEPVSKDNFGLKSDKCPPPVKELINFEKDLFALLGKLKFRKVNCAFQKKLNNDVKNIRSSNSTWVAADKTSNFYKLPVERYEQLVSNSITASYKKVNANIEQKINKNGKKIADNYNILDRIQVNGNNDSFITLKDHKPNFENNPTTRLINPAKNEVGRISKSILQNINTKLRNNLQLHQWNNTSSVLTWFNNIKSKSKYKFMIFDINNFYPSITSNLLNDSINFAKQYIDINVKDLDTIKHARKSLLFYNNESWMKKNGNLFDVTMGAYDGAEVCELVGLFLLHQLSLKYDKNNIGLYRDDGLAIFKDINGHDADKIRKDFHKTFKDNGLALDIRCNLKIVNFLDVTLDLNNSTYKPYTKPNDETKYIHANSNHPPSIIKQLPVSIENRLSSISCDKKTFNEAAKHYQSALIQSGYTYKLNYNPQNTVPDQRPTKKRKRKIIWFNPPYSKNVSTNVGKYFLNLVKKHFPKEHTFHKLFNKNNLKISYSCMNNINTIINANNQKIKNKQPAILQECNCIKRNECPLQNKCLTSNIVYKATISSNYPNYKNKTYIGISETKFKLRYANHKKSFNHTKYKNDSELSVEYWKLKEMNANPNITFSILKRCPPTKPSSKCYLCLNEKLFILESKNEHLLNKRGELVTKCRHKNKFKLCNHKT